MTVAVIYHFFPHYRSGVFEEMARHGAYRYVFVGSRVAVDESIKTWIPDADLDVAWTDIVSLPLGIKWQRGLLGVLNRPEINAALMLGDPHYLSTWAAAAWARLRSKKVYFWTHGWLRNDSGLRGFFKDCFFRLADGLLLYGHRAERIGIDRGFAKEKLSVIYNSLGTIEAEGVQGNRSAFSGLFSNDFPVVICTARLTQACRFDLLFEAASILKHKGQPVNVLLVGDGPVRKDLERQAERLGVSACFHGACYDESVLASMLSASDVLVSPGKVGLSAMHALAYGTPVVSHKDFDNQMPEFEAILPGKTGDFYESGNVPDLAEKIANWVARPDREWIRVQCKAVIGEKYNPRMQRELIEARLGQDGVPK